MHEPMIRGKAAFQRDDEVLHHRAQSHTEITLIYRFRGWKSMEIQLLVDSETIIWGKGVMGSIGTLSAAHNDRHFKRCEDKEARIRHTSVIVK